MTGRFSRVGLAAVVTIAGSLAAYPTMAQTRVYKVEISRPPDPRLKPAAEADRFLSRLARQGIDPKLVEKNKQALRTSLEGERRGLAASGVDTISVSDGGSMVSAVMPSLGGPAGGGAEAEVYDGQITVRWTPGWDHKTVLAGDQRTDLCRPSDFLVLCSFTGAPVSTKVQRPGPGRLVVTRIYRKPGHPDEVVEATYIGGEAKLARVSLRYVKPGARTFLAATYTVEDYKRQGVAWEPLRVKVLRYGYGGGLFQTEHYLLTQERILPPPPVASVFQQGDVVIDTRLGAGKQVSYAWGGKLPSVRALEDLVGAASSHGMTTRWSLVAFGGLLFLTGCGAWARKRRAGKHPG